MHQTDMLSILIPVYNFNIVPLVKEIRKQAIDKGIQYEIMVFDDGYSDPFREQNRMIREWDNIRYEELPENIGRSKIRNKMAALAAFPWLLFLDCDSQVVSNDYISQYLPYCSGQGVVCGGRTYQQGKPEISDQVLRWKYGKKRETKPASVRNLKPWNSFMTNNFMIQAQVLRIVRFDESIAGYGHEDTFFGIELKRKNIPVLHIDNPLLHIGLESNTLFLDKTLEGVKNLNLLMHKRKEYEGELILTVRLLRHFSFLRKNHVLRFYASLFAGIKKILMSNIMSRHPGLLLFDLYKLGIFVEHELLIQSPLE
jgi:glycosyltransferase involved in cell wall biosynthesis